ncbi:MAG TPA: hypothetical protein VEJ23_07145 [Solirubrobacteraceae bacterium]|nr:hypothetical protein [Solirubrobacteraceae bacterium]
MATSTAAAALRQIQANHPDEMDADVKDRLAQIARLLDERAGVPADDRMGQRSSELAKAERAVRLTEIAKTSLPGGSPARIELTNATRAERLALLKASSPRAYDAYCVAHGITAAA